jgi:hypothetical protein
MSALNALISVMTRVNPYAVCRVWYPHNSGSTGAVKTTAVTSGGSRRRQSRGRTNHAHHSTTRIGKNTSM